MSELHDQRSRPEGETTRTDERPPQHLAEPLLTFGLDQEIAALRREDAWERGDHNAKTLVKDEELRIILVVLKAGARLPEHQALHRIAIQVLAGQVRVAVPGRSVELKAGSLLTLEGGLAHDVEALAESAFLLTVAWHGAEAHPLSSGG
jgi:quercetin dioxygenase-like cupin family protein